LRNYTQVAGRRAMVRQVVLDRVMPPWFASHDSVAFRNDTRLSADDRLALLRWIQLDCPPGDPDFKPAQLALDQGWTIGHPDLVVELPAAVKLPATGRVPYVNKEIDLGLTQDRWVRKVQIFPTNPEVVHHVIMFAKNPKTKLWELFDSYLPGKPSRDFGDDSAFFLRAGASLLLNIHYTPNGIETEDRSRVGIKFADGPPKNVMTGKIVLLKSDIAIPPHAADFRADVDYVFEQEADLRTLMPHMHLRGRASIIELVFPDGRRERPLVVTRFNPNWQYLYELEQPIHVLPGTRMKITSVYDNSSANPFNPNPNATVLRGSQTDTEMGGAFIGWSLPLQRFLKYEAANLNPAVDTGDADFFGSPDGF
jgi:hypothetical protein